MKSSVVKKNISKRTILIGAVVVSLLIAAGVMLYLEKTRTTDFIKDPFYKNSSMDVDQATQSDTTTVEKADVNTVTPGVDTTKTSDQVPESTTASIVISSLTQSNSVVTPVVAITNPAAEGVCTFTFTKEGGKPVTKSVNTTTASCSVSISELEFEMLGAWQLEVKYFANDTQTAATSEIDIR